MVQLKYITKRVKDKHLTLIERGDFEMDIVVGERVRNENNNKFIRRHISKGIDIGNITKKRYKK